MKSGLELKKAEKVFKALANQARLCIVRELSAVDEQCVCNLVDCCDLSWSTVSHHLSLLKEAGIVTDEKRGKQVFYRLALTCVMDFICCLDAELNSEKVSNF